MRDPYENELFTDKANLKGPLASRRRPHSLQEFIGQEDIVQKLKASPLHSMLLYGPPGCGKTSLAKILAQQAKLPFFHLSAISTGVKEVRAIIEKGLNHFNTQAKALVLFLDEIHRFSRSQQDSLLGAVEAGHVILIGATTEHPAFEVTAPLLSRLRVYQLKALKNNELEQILQNALQKETQLAGLVIAAKAQELLLEAAGGDARRLLGNLELSAHLARSQSSSSEKVEISLKLVEQILVGEVRKYDKKGQYHYDTISAFIKSMRGSDPDAALLYMACMLNGGEDPLFIARRMLIFAAEDIGNAYPSALNLASSTFVALERIGMPEGRIILGQTAAFLASCPKSNATYLAIDRALSAVREKSIEIPKHLRNAPSKLHPSLAEQGKDYQYPHDFDSHFVIENYLPEGLENSQFYFPTHQGQEERLRAHLQNLWTKRNYD